MSSTRIVCSGSTALRLAAARDFLAAQPAASEVLVVGATREAADDLVREVSASSGATFGLHRLSFTQLAARLAEGTFATEGLAPAPSLTAHALAARAVSEARRASALEYFEPVADFPGFAPSLASTLQDLRLAAVDSTKLARLAGAGADLARLLELHGRLLTEARLADRAMLFAAATRALVESWRPVPLLLLDVEVRTRVERDFVAALLERAPSVLVTVPDGDDATRAALQTIVTPPFEVSGVGESSSLGRLQMYLFAEDAPRGAAADDSVQFFSAPGEGREAVEIARFILAEAAAGTRLDEIAVFTRTPGTYTSHIQTAFRRAGLPAYFARGTLRPDPSGRAFLALLSCAAERLSARRFAEYLSFAQVPRDRQAAAESGDGWTPLADETSGSGAAAAARSASESNTQTPPAADDSAATASLPAPWRWESLLVEAAVIGGAERWQRRLTGLENQLRRSVEEIERDDPESARRAHLERQLVYLGQLQEFALPLVRELDAYAEPAPWGVWLERLCGLAPRVLRSPERTLRLLAELQPMDGLDPVPIAEVRDVLAERLSFLEEDPPAYRFGQVFVGPPELARGRSFAVVFVPGLAERVFPQRPREDPLLLDAARQQVSELLDTQDHRSARERLLLRLATGAAERRLYLSFPRVDPVEARARVTSFYGLDILRAVHGEIPDVEAFERRADAAVGARLAWPAPPQPERAIDAVEHDLAVLRGLIHERDPTQAKGRAQYLLHLNEHLGRSLRTRFWRWQRKNWSGLDGLVEKTEALAPVLEQLRPTARPYSASALEKFAACPYRFLLAAVHRLEAREEAVPIERMDPLTRGRLFHEVQARTLRRLADDGLLPLGEARRGDAEARLNATLAEVAARYRDDLCPAIARVWEDEAEAIHTDLLSWLRHVERESDRWQPSYFELGFGLGPSSDRDPHSRTEPVVLSNGYLLRGAVDLVEKHGGRNLLRVTDHKTGVNRTEPGLVVNGGQTLQPVLYGLAVEAVVGAPVGESRLFYCTARGGFEEVVVAMNEGARRAAVNVLETIDRSVADGFLPPAPADGACERCDFRVVCGPYEEERARKKDHRRLAPLVQLRGRP